jgi:tape measure domain-containing protein
MAEELGGLTATMHIEVDQSEIEKAKKQINSAFSGNVGQGKNFIDHWSEDFAKAQKQQEESVKRWKEYFDSTQAKIKETAKTATESSDTAAETVKKNVKSAATLTKQEIDGVDTVLKKVAGYVGAYFAVDSLRGFVSNAIAVRNQFASVEKSFNVLLGDEEKAKKLFEDIKVFGATTPMDLGGLAESAKMMLGFGIPLKDIMADLKALGDVAMGDQSKFMSLSLAFSQASAAGKLMGNDLLQMINAGFNPLETMAKTTGKSIAELKDEMSQGKISADMLRQALMDATAEGGKYHGMLYEQSKTMAGAYSNLMDTIDGVYNEIGELIEDKAVAFYQFLDNVVSNYKEIAKVLAELTAAYGVYRAALMTITAFQNASAIATRMNTVAIATQGTAVKKVTALQVLFAKAQKTVGLGMSSLAKMINPYTLIAVAVAGLTYAIYKAVTAQTDYEKSLEKVKKIQSETNEKISNEQSECDVLFDKLKRLAKGSEEYNAVKQTIMDKYGEYLQHLSKEKQSLDDIKGAYEGITFAIQDKMNMEAMAESRKTYQQDLFERKNELQQMLFNQISYKFKDKATIERQKDQAKEFVKGLLLSKTDEDARDFLELWKPWIDSFKGKIDTYTNFNAVTGQRETYTVGGQNYALIAAQKFISQKSALDKALKDAEDMFLWQNDWTQTNGNPEDKTNGKPGQELDLSAEKAKIAAVRKYAEEYVKIQQERNSKLKALDNDFEKTEKQKAEERLKIEQDVADKLSTLNATSLKVTDEERKNIAEYYKKKSDITVETAREELPKTLRKLAELDEGIKTSKKGTKKNAAKINFNTKTAAGESAELAIDKSVAEYIIAESKKDVDFSGLTAKYAEFVQSYIDITENGKVKLAEIKKQLDNKGLTEQEKTRLQNELEWETNETQMEVQRLIQKFDGKEYDNLKMIITEVFSTTGNQMQTVINAQIVSLEKQISEFGKVDTKERAEELAELKTKLAATQAALERLKREMQSSNKTNRFWKDFSNNLSDIQGKTDDLFNQISKIDETLGGSAAETIQNVQSVFDNTYALIGGIKNFADVCAKGIIETGNAVKTAMNMIETASAILAIISAVISMIRLLKSILEKEDPLAKFNDSMKLANLELKEFRRELEQIQGLGKYQTIFGDDVWGQMGEKINYAKQALQRLSEVGKENNYALMNPQMYALETMGGKGDSIVSTYEKRIDSLKDWKAILTETVENMTFEVGTEGALWWKKHIMSNIGTAVPELFDENGEVNMDMLSKFVDQQSEAYQKLSEDQKTFLKQSVDDWKEYKDYIQQVKDVFSNWFGGLTNEIADMWVSAFKTGKYELEDFKNVWNNTIEQMAVSIMQSNLISPIFKQMQEKLDGMDFYEMVKSNPEKAFDSLIGVMNDGLSQVNTAYKSGEKFMQYYHDNYGLFQTDAEKNEREVLSGGGIQSITQDTAEELNGRITQIQSHTYNISECSTQMREFAQQQLIILQGIKSDTARLESIETEITTVRSVVSEIKDRGIKLK